VCLFIYLSVDIHMRMFAFLHFPISPAVVYKIVL